MAKQYKIRRYQRIYRQGPGRRVGRVLVILLVFCVLFAVGWLIYQPVYDLLLGVGEGRSAPSVSENSSVPQVEPEPARSQTPVPEKADSPYKMAYLPASVLADQTTLMEYLETLKAIGADSVMIDLKDAEGKLLYRSALPQAQTEAVGSSVIYDLKPTVATIRGAGLRVVGRVFAFVDRSASSAYPEMSVRYKGTTYTWLDNKMESGGEPWLNPCSSEAREYLLSILTEGLDAGIQAVALDGVQFPSGYGLDLASYLEGEEEVADRPEVLCAFLDEAAQLVEERGGEHCWLTMPASDLIVADSDVYSRFGGDAARVAQGRELLLGVMPGSVTEEAALELPGSAAINAYESVKAQLERVPLDQEQLVTPILQAYTTGEAAVGGDEVADQLRACSEVGLGENYFLYNPAGNYEFMK